MEPSTEERVRRSNAGETAGKAAFWLLAVAGLRKASAKTAFLNEKEREAFEDAVTKEENLCRGLRTLRGFQLEEVLESLCLSPSVVEKLKEPLLQQKLSTQLVHHALSDHAKESQVRVIVQFLCKIQAYDCVPSMLEIVLEYKDALASAGLDAGRPNFFIAELCRQIPVFLKRAFFDTLVKMHGSGTQAMAESMIAELYRLNDWGTCKLVGELVLLSFDFFQATAMPLCEWASDRMGSRYQQPAVAYLLDGLVLHKCSEIGNTAMQLLRHWASTIDSSGVPTSLKLLIVSGLARLLPMPKDVELVQSILQLIVKASVCWPEDTRCPLVHPLLDCIMDSLKASSTVYADPCLKIILRVVDHGLEAEHLLLQPPTSGEDMHCNLLDGPQAEQASLLRRQVGHLISIGGLDVRSVSFEVCEHVGDHLLHPHQFASWLDG